MQKQMPLDGLLKLNPKRLQTKRNGRNAKFGKSNYKLKEIVKRSQNNSESSLKHLQNKIEKRNYKLR